MVEKFIDGKVPTSLKEIDVESPILEIFSWATFNDGDDDTIKILIPKGRLDELDIRIHKMNGKQKHIVGNIYSIKFLENFSYSKTVQIKTKSNFKNVVLYNPTGSSTETIAYGIEENGDYKIIEFDLQDSADGRIHFGLADFFTDKKIKYQ